MNGRRSEAVVVAAKRTPIARLDGELAALDAQTLAAQVITALVADLQLPVDAVDDVIVATAAGPGGNLARRAVLDAGLGTGVPGLTIDRQCGGGLDAILLAARLVEAGAGHCYIAGGVESASRSPLRAAAGPDRGANGRRFFPRHMFAGGGHDDPGMAESAEIIASELGIGRVSQDQWAARSHARAATAVTAGTFVEEIVPVPVGDHFVSLDSCPRATLTVERCARFPAIVASGGTVTAANSSQIADAAAFAVVMSREAADRRGRSGLVHRGSATAGVDPRMCGLGAVAAVRRLEAAHPELEREPIRHVAFTEAFAVQVCATITELQLDAAIVNPNGGAIGLGHPWGASGAVQVVRLMAELEEPGASGLAMAAIAGGMGTAAWFTRDGHIR